LDLISIDEAQNYVVACHHFGGQLFTTSSKTKFTNSHVDKNGMMSFKFSGMLLQTVSAVMFGTDKLIPNFKHLKK